MVACDRGLMEGHDVNVRRLGKPPLFDGTENAWSDWSFGTRACLDTLLSYPITLAELTAPRAALSRKMHFVLTMFLKGHQGRRVGMQEGATRKI